MISIILFLFLGILAGTVTGLIPGIHVNLISVILLSTPLTIISPIPAIVFITSMAITHTFLDFIPSVFLGAPDTDTELSVLPGHEFLMQGKAHQAIILTLYGSMLGVIIIFLFTPIFIFLLPLIYSYIKTAMFFILITASSYLIIKEKTSKPLALFIFILAGFLGISALNLNISQPLLPLLTGLFGASSLITSIIKTQKIPQQKISNLEKIKPTSSQISNSFIAAILSAPLCTFLPSLGSSQAAVIGTDLIQQKDKKQFLILLGSINTIVAGLAFITLYSISATRTGAAIAVNQAITSLTSSHLLIILATILLSSLISIFLAIKISKLFSKNISRFNYRHISLFVLLFLSAISIIFSGILGLLIFIISAATGLTAILAKVRRTHLMGALMIPTILIYFPF